jgi:hypothetical protein
LCPSSLAVHEQATWLEEDSGRGHYDTNKNKLISLPSINCVTERWCMAFITVGKYMLSPCWGF